MGGVTQGHVGGSHLFTQVLQSRELFLSIARGKCESWTVAGFEDRERGHTLALEAGKDNKKDFPQNHQKGAQPCQLLGFSPGRPCEASNLQNCKISNRWCFRPLTTCVVIWQ